MRSIISNMLTAGNSKTTSAGASIAQMTQHFPTIAGSIERQFLQELGEPFSPAIIRTVILRPLLAAVIHRSLPNFASIDHFDPQTLVDPMYYQVTANFSEALEATEVDIESTSALLKPETGYLFIVEEASLASSDTFQGAYDRDFENLVSQMSYHCQALAAQSSHTIISDANLIKLLGLDLDDLVSEGFKVRSFDDFKKLEPKDLYDSKDSELSNHEIFLGKFLSPRRVHDYLDSLSFESKFVQEYIKLVSVNDKLYSAFRGVAEITNKLLTAYRDDIDYLRRNEADFRIYASKDLRPLVKTERYIISDSTFTSPASENELLEDSMLRFHTQAPMSFIYEGSSAIELPLGIASIYSRYPLKNPTEEQMKFGKLLEDPRVVTCVPATDTLVIEGNTTTRSINLNLADGGKSRHRLVKSIGTKFVAGQVYSGARLGSYVDLRDLMPHLDTRQQVTVATYKQEVVQNKQMLLPVSYTKQKFTWLPNRLSSRIDSGTANSPFQFGVLSTDKIFMSLVEEFLESILGYFSITLRSQTSNPTEVIAHKTAVASIFDTFAWKEYTLEFADISYFGHIMDGLSFGDRVYGFQKYYLTNVDYDNVLKDRAASIHELLAATYTDDQLESILNHVNGVLSPSPVRRVIVGLDHYKNLLNPFNGVDKYIVHKYVCAELGES
jgi:hypothetical protein